MLNLRRLITKSSIPSTRRILNNHYISSRFYSDTANKDQSNNEQQNNNEQASDDVNELLKSQKKATDDALELQKQLKVCLYLFRYTISYLKLLQKDLQYAAADFNNLQRIAQREKDLAQEKGTMNLGKSLLPVMDILPLAIKSVNSEHLTPLPESDARYEDRKNLITLHEGLVLLQSNLTKALKENDIESVDPTGEKFNPDNHEALYQAPIPGKEPGSVLECSKLGYSYKGRTLRAAQVGVVQDTS